MNTNLTTQISELIVECGYEELGAVNRMINSMRKELDDHYIQQINIGNVVVFDYRGKTIVGKVIRINKKTVTITLDGSKRTARVSLDLIIKGSQRKGGN